MNISEHNGCIAKKITVAYNWKTSLGLAIALHLLTFVAAVFTPSLFASRPQIPEFYTVDLFNVAEINEALPAKQSPQTPAAAPASPAQPEPAPAAVPVKPLPPATPVTPSPTKAISIEPLKEKIKVIKPIAIDEQQRIEQAKLERAFKRVQAQIREKETREKAERLRQEALEKVRSSYRNTQTPAPRPGPVSPATEPVSSAVGTAVGTAANSGAAKAGPEMSAALRRYYAAVLNHIQRHWVLPPMQDWDSSLEAILVINIHRDGIITKTFFESKSNNVYFNQFVMKTVREAAPLPVFPADLEDSFVEIGLRFHPTEEL